MKHESFGVSYGGWTAGCACGAEFNRHTKGEALAALREHIDLQKPMIGAMSAAETAQARRELGLP